MKHSLNINKDSQKLLRKLTKNRILLSQIMKFKENLLFNKNIKIMINIA